MKQIYLKNKKNEKHLSSKLKQNHSSYYLINIKLWTKKTNNLKKQLVNLKKP